MVDGTRRIDTNHVGEDDTTTTEKTMSIPFADLAEKQRVKWREHFCTIVHLATDFVQFEADNNGGTFRLYEHHVNGSDPLTELLVSEDPTKGQEVAAAAFNLGSQINFEHGKWWVTNVKTGAQWSVVDTNEGLDFEQVTEGEECEEILFRNSYCCYNCETKWTDDWSCTCDDRCPKCNSTNSPIESVEV